VTIILKLIKRETAWKSNPEGMTTEYVESRGQCWAYVNMVMSTQVSLQKIYSQAE
jgi:hypothetical protein